MEGGREDLGLRVKSEDKGQEERAKPVETGGGKDTDRQTDRRERGEQTEPRAFCF